MLQKIKIGIGKPKVKTLLVFLFFSTSAWFISNLSESYITDTTFDLTYDNTLNDLLLVDASHTKLNAKVEASGFQLFRFNFKKKKVAINLSAIEKKGERYFISYEAYTDQIEKQLSNSIRLIDIERDTLFFDFQEVVTKELAVEPRVNLTLAQNYLLEGELKVQPSMIKIRGPHNEVDTISRVRSVPINLSDLTSDFSQKVGIEKSDALQNTTFSEVMVVLSGKVSRFSEQVMSLPIKAVNLPDDTTLQMFPDKVSVLCKGTITTLKNLSVSDFEVLADFEKSNGKTIPLQLHRKPKQLSSATLQEKEIEFILKRAQ